MPRGVAVKLASGLETDGNNAPENKHQCVIKKECNGPGEQVFHRKSERRRVARDIFLVFEEQSTRRLGRRGCNGRRSQIKSKFGHLMVDSAANVRTKAGLLRDIKNEPKCYLSPVGTQPAAKNKNVSKKGQIKLSNNAKGTTTVNPIFLWAKQDDTRIVEVRCEDYDKRNRIRITKTTTGWRAIPRSDASTSRIVKFFQTPSSLIKLKREMYDNKLLIHDIISLPTSDSLSAVVTDTMQRNLVSESDEAEIEMNASRELLRGLTAETEKHATTLKPEADSCGVSCSDGTVVIQQEEPLQSVAETNDLTHIGVIESLNVTSDERNIRMEDEVMNSSNTYQTYNPELQLCPETGLFIPSSCRKSNKDDDLSDTVGGMTEIDIRQCLLSGEGSQLDSSVIENLDTESTNLKDLLDNADLLQHCGDNTNSDSELIDSLVKHSCESNLITQSEMLKDPVCLNIFSKSVENGAPSPPQHPLDVDIVENMIPQMIDTVTEPPKCLSFNEAGEIEGVNSELFHASDNFADAYTGQTLEQSTVLLSKELESVVDLPLGEPASVIDQTMSGTPIDNTPRDLTYKKPDAVVSTSSEPQGQCAVTSSSDVLLSPHQDDVPVAVESATETIKNFILEQFMNLNALSSLPNSTPKKQQSEPIDLGKQKKLEDETFTAVAPNFIETVVIEDDNSNDEPAKKKLCTSVDDVVDKVVSKVVSKAPVATNIDEDPDPLTQLQLLLKNTQWKVPDPILVPKDRLSAVLASPAREIPLLITTRPELRLPEAFAYPHIIQNPNILVISMAQLEAILKNEMESEKARSPTDVIVDKFQSKGVHATPKPTSKDLNTKCSYVDSNSMASNINTATLAVINQMLWLPYFGQWSQEFIKSIKNPMALQHQYTNFLSPYNHFQFGLQNLDELYKSYLKQLSQFKLPQGDNEAAPGFQSPPMYVRAMGAVQNHLDLMVLQKLLQQPIQSFPTLDQTPTSSTSLSLSSSSSQKDQDPTSSLNESASSMLHKVHMHPMEQQRCTKELLDLNPTINCTADYSNNIDVPDKPPCLQKLSSDNNVELSQLSSINKKQILKSKPRLTCKSLSNLLEPESRSSRNSINLINHLTEAQANGRITTSYQGNNCLPPPDSNPAAATWERANLTPMEMEKQCQRNSAISGQSEETLNNNADFLNANENSALLHPLFNSNMNAGYGSQWKWTTVTATGE